MRSPMINTHTPLPPPTPCWPLLPYATGPAAAAGASGGSNQQQQQQSAHYWYSRAYRALKQRASEPSQLVREYQHVAALDYSLNHSTAVAKSRAAAGRNRYANVLPFDYNRCVLLVCMGSVRMRVGARGRVWRAVIMTLVCLQPTVVRQCPTKLACLPAFTQHSHEHTGWYCSRRRSPTAAAAPPAPPATM